MSRFLRSRMGRQLMVVAALSLVSGAAAGLGIWHKHTHEEYFATKEPRLHPYLVGAAVGITYFVVGSIVIAVSNHRSFRSGMAR